MHVIFDGVETGFQTLYALHGSNNNGSPVFGPEQIELTVR